MFAITDAVNPSWGVAAILSFLIFALHLFGGGRQFARPLLASRELAADVRMTLWYGWHIVTISIAAMGTGFALAAYDPAAANLGYFMTGLSASFMLLSLGIIVLRYPHPFALPQWIFFMAVAAAGIAGAL